jgi:energy-coupling factor transporter ATP-binding protein EcfA2
MERVIEALEKMESSLKERHQNPPITFEAFLEVLSEAPSRVLRNVFQTFFDMMTTYVGEGQDEYPNDPESIQFVHYDFSRLFVEKADNPFFADRLFANRLMTHVESMHRGAQQNKIYIFDGPPGCGKSTFLNNLLNRFEEYSKTEDGRRYEAVWHLDWRVLCRPKEPGGQPLTYEKLFDYFSGKQRELIAPVSGDPDAATDATADACEPSGSLFFSGDHIEVPCPSHDHPILMIPKHYRRTFFDDLFQNDEFKWKLFTEKAYDWVFKDQPCTICQSIYWALLRRLESPLEVFKMLYARPYQFNRRLGEGISVFNPGDRPMRQNVLTNPMLQRRINGLLRDSNQVKYIFSRYAKSNNGIYALMDIKTHNIERLIELHNIISEGVHKVEDIEEKCQLAAHRPDEPRGQEKYRRHPLFFRSHRVHPHPLRPGPQHRGRHLPQYFRPTHRGQLPAPGASQFRTHRDRHPPQNPVRSDAGLDRQPG